LQHDRAAADEELAPARLELLGPDALAGKAVGFRAVAQDAAELGGEQPPVPRVEDILGEDLRPAVEQVVGNLRRRAGGECGECGERGERSPRERTQMPSTMRKSRSTDSPSVRSASWYAGPS
jgi:hypothetical protein